ncbi:bifunctional pyridoxamine 5'-phosphate oxidase family protein/GNAT family N-acetyltransferase [Actinoplanes sp. Pm04-4]|uniref:Bifunctional pyridoxamine 5'-phosphate oxidase family protein/GNAT family N-acetyltransferase n=1 Tax=Paractinoplanes pyxinae TaxID=2997416 RepID=A0ABT4BFA9_9ACTN|nr:bifunctional pyridoxamine 5'-phosphate oxidase family protein/GNAT family N-acetyltransferase [Actinoplanes pyxinae]MCY1145157.1 bifunctional pyridoxamine 5'-phosphate oxidase family protein/GNAT family N-acetyltransferase [Actinoplanes pyxinae]
MHYDRALAHAILDEAYDCTVGFVADGEPRVLPTLHVRVGETLYLHGSSGGRMGLTVRHGEVPVAVSVTLLDGIVYARSHVHHSANYRSVVVHGPARLVTDPDEKKAAMAALVDKVGAGRAADSRPPNKREMAETSVLALELREVSARARSGGVIDDEDDLSLPHWAGVLPVRQVFGPPAAADGVSAALPAYLPGSELPWAAPVPLTGRHVRLEPLTLGHAAGLVEALGDDEVWQHMPTTRPRTVEAMRDYLTRLLGARWSGSQVAWAQVEPATGRVLGMTSYHDIDPERRALAIGHTIVGRPWWRTGVNTEAKLLLLTHAFDELKAERVSWYTDIRNERSQQAIARLGAVREGVLRRHKQRPDGSWRDTVVFGLTVDEWPAAGQKLRERLTAG